LSKVYLDLPLQGKIVLPQTDGTTTVFRFDIHLLNMKLAVLCSGGKDSSYALWLALKEGHDIVKIVSMFPERENSWMFHSPNPEFLKIYSETSKIPLLKRETSGEKERELEDLKLTLQALSVDGVVSGAVASNYQKGRIDRICEDLGFESVTPLWKKDPDGLLNEILEEGFKTIITSVSAEGLTREWLGREIDQNCIKDLKRLNEEKGVHVTGEGGEYETLVLDAPFFEKRIEIEKSEGIWKGDRGSLNIKKAGLVDR